MKKEALVYAEPELRWLTFNPRTVLCLSPEGNTDNEDITGGGDISGDFE